MPGYSEQCVLPYPLKLSGRVHPDPKRIDREKCWIRCKDYPRDTKFALEYKVPPSSLHARENAVEILPPVGVPGSIIWADIRVSPPPAARL